MLGGRGSDDYGSLDYYNMMREQNVAKLSKNGDSVGTGTGRVMHSNRDYGGGYSFGEDFGGQSYGGINPNLGGVAFGGSGRFWTGGPGHMVGGRVSDVFSRTYFGNPFTGGSNYRDSMNPNFGSHGSFWTGGPGHMVEGRILKYFQQNILRSFNRGGHLQICD